MHVGAKNRRNQVGQSGRLCLDLVHLLQTWSWRHWVASSVHKPSFQRLHGSDIFFREFELGILMARDARWTTAAPIESMWVDLRSENLLKSVSSKSRRAPTRRQTALSKRITWSWKWTSVAAKSPMIYSAYSASSPALCGKAVDVARNALFHVMLHSPAVETVFVGLTVPKHISRSPISSTCSSLLDVE